MNNVEVNNLLSSDLMSRQTVEGNLLFTNDLDVSGYLSSKSFENGCDLKLVNCFYFFRSIQSLEKLIIICHF